MLNFFTTSNGFRSTLPVVSNLTAMNVWDGVCMCCIYASLLEFVLVNYVGRKRSDWPLPIVYQNKDQDYKQITQVRFHYTLFFFLHCIRVPQNKYHIPATLAYLFHCMDVNSFKIPIDDLVIQAI